MAVPYIAAVMLAHGALFVAPSLVYGSAQELTAPDTPVVLPTEMCRDYFIVSLTAGSEEKRALKFLLDTGSSWTFIDPGTLAALRRVLPRRVDLGDLRAGEHRFPRQPLRVLPMRRLSLALGRDVDGILGFPSFSDVLLTLDYQRREVRISRGQLGPVNGRDVVRATRGRRPHVHATLDNQRVVMLIDSGFSGGFQLRPSRQLSWRASPRVVGSAYVVGGYVVREGGRLASAVTLGPMTFDEPVVTLARETAQVGHRVLRHYVLAFDQRTRRVQLQTAHESPVRDPPLTGLSMAYVVQPNGWRVVEVFAEGSIGAADVQVDDVITAVDGIPVQQRGCNERKRPEAGRQQRLTYLRNGRSRDVVVRADVLVP